MYVASHYLVGIVALHAFALYWYLTGTLVRSPRALRNDAAALVDVVITTAAGMALFGFAVFAIGIVGLLDVRGFALAGIVEVAAIAILMRRTKSSAAEFWTSRFSPLRRASTPATFIVYAVLLVLAIPATLPVGAFDVMQYYLPYPFEWAHAAHIYIDETLPTPYYANNFLLFYAAYFRLGLGEYTNFLPWFCGALSALGIFGTVRAFALSQTRVGHSMGWLTLGVPFAVTASFAFEPTFLRWVNTGMLDVPLGLFIFVPVMSMALMLIDRECDYRRELVLTAGFLVGMKPPMLAYLPLFASLLVIASPTGEPKRRTVGLLTLILILSAPWYAMNFVLNGDPAPPALHLVLHRPDPLFTVGDVKQMSSGLRTSTSPVDLIELPVRFFWNALGYGFVEYGASVAVMFIYVPFFAVGYALARRRAAGMPAVVLFLTGAFIYGFAYWVTTSYHARFFLELMPIYFAALGVLALWFVQNRPARVGQVVFVILILGVVPSTSAWGYLNSLYLVDYAGIGSYIPSRAFFNENWCDGCQEADYVAAHLAPGSKVFTLDLMNTTYLLRERGITNFGSKYSNVTDRDLFAAVEDRNLSGFVHHLSISAFLINTTSEWPDASRSLFVQQTLAMGFHQYEYPRPRKDGHIIVFLR